jgi:hypothetical protein
LRGARSHNPLAAVHVHATGLAVRDDLLVVGTVQSQLRVWRIGTGEAQGPTFEELHDYYLLHKGEARCPTNGILSEAECGWAKSILYPASDFTTDQSAQPQGEDFPRDCYVIGHFESTGMSIRKSKVKYRKASAIEITPAFASPMRQVPRAGDRGGILSARSTQLINLTEYLPAVLHTIFYTYGPRSLT